MHECNACLYHVYYTLIAYSKALKCKIRLVIWQMPETLRLSVFLRIYNIYFSRFLQKSGNFAPEFTYLNSLICISNGILTIIFLNGHPVRDIARAYGRILKVARTIADIDLNKGLATLYDINTYQYYLWRSPR